MAWIEGSLEKTITVNAPFDEVVEFYTTPSKFRVAFTDLERHEEIDDLTVRYVLEEKSEKGITFQGDYTVKYSGDAEDWSWETIGSGTMKSSGWERFRDLGNGKTEVTHSETLSCDLPIPRLMAKVFRPIVSREVTTGITDFLEKSKAALEEG